MGPRLTTPERVRNRMGFTTEDMTDTLLTEFIEDQQAFLENEIDQTWQQGDDGYELARAVVTDLAAMMGLVRITGGTTSGLDYKLGKLEVDKGGQLENRLRVIFEMKTRAQQGIRVLESMGRKHTLHVINGAD